MPNFWCYDSDEGPLESDFLAERRHEQSAPDCPYCGNAAEFRRGTYNGHEANRWVCDPCDASVGCHRTGKNGSDGRQPFGALANAPLRAARQRAHSAFDPLWKSGGMSRGEAYAWLSKGLGLSIDLTHIGLFDIETCNRVVALCKPKTWGF